MNTAVFRHAENAVGMICAFLHAFDEYSLARFEDIDGTPLEEADVCDFATSEEVATIIERHHGVARHPDKEVCPFVLELRYDIALAVLHAYPTATFGRETGDCIERYEWYALAAAMGNLAGYLNSVLRSRRIILFCFLKHCSLTSEQPFSINIEL